MPNGTICTGGGIVDSSGLGGETKDSVIHMYNQLVFDNHLTEFID
jgi:hypothetical protein